MRGFITIVCTALMVILTVCVFQSETNMEFEMRAVATIPFVFLCLCIIIATWSKKK